LVATDVEKAGGKDASGEDENKDNKSFLARGVSAFGVAVHDFNSSSPEYLKIARGSLPLQPMLQICDATAPAWDCPALRQVVRTGPIALEASRNLIFVVFMRGY